jgi:hypothetical protein
VLRPVRQLRQTLVWALSVERVERVQLTSVLERIVREAGVDDVVYLLAAVHNAIDTAVNLCVAAVACVGAVRRVCRRHGVSGTPVLHSYSWDVEAVNVIVGTMEQQPYYKLTPSLIDPLLSLAVNR